MDHVTAKKICFGFIAAVAVLCAPVFATEQPATPKPYLWKITKDGAAAYVFGTIHVSDPRVTEIPGAVTHAVNVSDAVYTEIPSDIATLMAASQQMMLPDGQKLDEILPPETLEQLTAELHAIHPVLTIDAVNRLKIWALAASLTLLEDQIQSAGKPALDTKLFTEAAQAGKRTGGLESLDEQVAVFELLDQEEQIEFLQATLAQMAEAREQGTPVLEEMIGAYLDGDIDALHRLLEDSLEMDGFEITPEFRRALFEDRNVRMAGRIADLVRLSPETTFFFAVGAGHLPGKEGVLALLEADGFQLKRIPAEKPAEAL